MGLLRSFGRGALLGAGLTYFFDPERGNRRRSLIRDKIVHYQHRFSDSMDKMRRDLSNRAEGFKAELRSAVSSKDVSDRVLCERVRARIGRVSTHPSAIEVSAHQGRVTLRGPILANEAECVFDEVRSVPGVQSVDNQMEMHSSPEGISALQGEGRLPVAMPINWSPASRLLMGWGGAAMLASGILRGRPLSTMLGTIGLGLAAGQIFQPGLGRIMTAGVPGSGAQLRGGQSQARQSQGQRAEQGQRQTQAQQTPGQTEHPTPAPTHEGPLAAHVSETISEKQSRQ